MEMDGIKLYSNGSGVKFVHYCAFVWIEFEFIDASPSV